MLWANHFADAKFRASGVCLQYTAKYTALKGAGPRELYFATTQTKHAGSRQSIQKTGRSHSGFVVFPFPRVLLGIRVRVYVCEAKNVIFRTGLGTCRLISSGLLFDFVSDFGSVICVGQETFTSNINRNS